MSLPEPYYQDDSVTLYHGDCRDLIDFLSPPDLLLTDPPYGIGADSMTLGNGKREVYRGERSWDDERPVITPFLDTRVGAVVWGGQFYNLPPSRGWLVWDKHTGDNDYGDCELAWTTRDAPIRKFDRGWVGSNAKERHEGDRSHPTQKPVALMEWSVGFFPDAESVFDPFCGTGASLVAVKAIGLSGVGIEIEERYCEVAAERLSQGVLDLDTA